MCFICDDSFLVVLNHVQQNHTVIIIILIYDFYMQQQKLEAYNITHLSFPFIVFSTANVFDFDADFVFVIYSKFCEKGSFCCFGTFLGNKKFYESLTLINHIF